ncbi:UNVERIFIED_CONTAM: hypothetical protein FKN15_037571, partial [Acipenser sinensis]
AVNEFPQDIFSAEERRRGAVLLHVFCAMYMFYALAIVCDDFFVPSLEKISENLHLSEDVAGATFMAAGSSAPELFTSLIGVFITKGDLGVGTIVGSAVFNILVIIGVCGVFAGQTISLTWWSLFRDSVFYTFSVVALILGLPSGASGKGSLSGVQDAPYSLEVAGSSPGYSIADRRQELPGGGAQLAERRPGGGRVRKPINYKLSLDHFNVLIFLTYSKSFRAIILCFPPAGRCSVSDSSPVLMVDELFCQQPHQLSFPEASLRIMITQHFSPRTRLSMAGRMLINERQRLIRTSSPGSSSWSGAGPKTPVKDGGGGVAWPLENGGALDNERQLLEEPSERREEREGPEQREEERPLEGEEEEEEEEEEGGVFQPFHIPGGLCARVKWLVSWPLSLLLFFTVPNCMQPRWESWFMATFAMSTLWIGIFSYIMVWMMTLISYTLGIPDVIMGITFLAAGTSVPDCMASLIVARQGMGDMAVSNSIGSNIFDILLGLGFPWAMQTLVVDYGSSVFINSKGLLYSVILLLASVFLTVLSVHLNNWKLDRKLGLGTLSLYTVFLLCSILIELNVIVSLPPCH